MKMDSVEWLCVWQQKQHFKWHFKYKFNIDLGGLMGSTTNLFFLSGLLSFGNKYI